MDTRQFEARKQEHLRHALDPAHQTLELSGLASLHLIHEALPQFDLADVSLEVHALKRPSRTPFYISAMTAGHATAANLNRTFAAACERRGWALGVGSQRRELHDKDSGDHWRELRQEHPGTMIFSNLGLSQLPALQTDQVLRLAENLTAAAIVIHTNPLQEALQPEGTPAFSRTMEALARLCQESHLPVILKETGCGFSEASLKRLIPLGLAAVDVAGLGGTHWGRIEGARAPAASVQARASEAFANWGEGTVASVIRARRILPSGTQVWASGGVRTGVDAAKLIALGSDLVGFAQPALRAALNGEEALTAWMETREYELRVALFCTGCKNPSELKNLKPIIGRSETHGTALELN